MKRNIHNHVQKPLMPHTSLSWQGVWSFLANKCTVQQINSTYRGKRADEQRLPIHHSSNATSEKEMSHTINMFLSQQREKHELQSCIMNHWCISHVFLTAAMKLQKVQVMTVSVSYESLTVICPQFMHPKVSLITWTAILLRCPVCSSEFNCASPLSQDRERKAAWKRFKPKLLLT